MRDDRFRGYTVTTEVTPKKGDGDFFAGAIVMLLVLALIGWLAG